MRINRFFLVCVIVVLVLVVALFTLRARRPLAPTAEEIRRTFPEDTQPASAAATAGLDIYVDGSGSMQGFLASKGSIFRQTLSDLLLSATQNGFDMRIYKFTSTIQPVGGAPMSALQDASFYNGADTPLATLIRQIGANPNRTSILVSDLVLSSRKEDNQELVKSMAALGAKRPQIELLGYRSDFEGRYQSERSHDKPYVLHASQSTPDNGRPFYLIVVAPDAASMNKVKKDLLNHIQADSKKFEATSPAFEVHGAKLTVESPPRQWISVSRYAVRNKGSNRFETAFRLASAAAGESVDLPVTLTYAAHVPFHRAAELSLAGQVASFEKESGATKGTTGHAPDGQPSARNGWAFSAASDVVVPLVENQKQEKGVEASSDGGNPDQDKTVSLLLRMPTPKARRWTIYRLRIRPGESNLDLPEWTTKWSTDDDSVATNGNKTYMLQLLVGTMESAITQERVCGDWILRVGGEE